MATTGHARRLAALAVVFAPAPPGCVGRGRFCRRFDVVRDGAPEPAVPASSAMCERCGRPVFRRIWRLIGVEAERV